MQPSNHSTRDGILAGLGRFTHKKRGLVTALSLATLALSGVLIAGGNEFEDGNQPPQHRGWAGTRIGERRTSGDIDQHSDLHLLAR